MTQDERWDEKWKVAVEFINAHKRNPSKYDGVEREIRNWIKHQRKLFNVGKLKEERITYGS